MNLAKSDFYLLSGVVRLGKLYSGSDLRVGADYWNDATCRQLSVRGGAVLMPGGNFTLGWCCYLSTTSVSIVHNFSNELESVSMKRFSKLVRRTALAGILAATAGLVAANVADVSSVGSDYLVRTDVAVTPRAELASSDSAGAATLSDWEYTKHGRPPKCGFDKNPPGPPFTPPGPPPWSHSKKN